MICDNTHPIALEIASMMRASDKVHPFTFWYEDDTQADKITCELRIGECREVFTVEGASSATSEDFRREIRRTFRDVWPARQAKKWKVRR